MPLRVLSAYLVAIWLMLLPNLAFGDTAGNCEPILYVTGPGVNTDGLNMLLAPQQLESLNYHEDCVVIIRQTDYQTDHETEQQIAAAMRKARQEGYDVVVHIDMDANLLDYGAPSNRDERKPTKYKRARHWCAHKLNVVSQAYISAGGEGPRVLDAHSAFADAFAKSLAPGRRYYDKVFLSNGKANVNEMVSSLAKAGYGPDDVILFLNLHEGWFSTSNPFAGGSISNYDAASAFDGQSWRVVATGELPEPLVTNDTPTERIINSLAQAIELSDITLVNRELLNVYKSHTANVDFQNTPFKFLIKLDSGIVSLNKSVLELKDDVLANRPLYSVSLPVTTTNASDISSTEMLQDMNRRQTEPYLQDDWRRYIFFEPPDGFPGAAISDPGGVLFDLDNIYVADRTGKLARLEQTVLEYLEQTEELHGTIEVEGETMSYVAFPPSGKVKLYVNQDTGTIVAALGDSVCAIRLLEHGGLYYIVEIVEGIALDMTKDSVTFTVDNSIILSTSYAPTS